MIVSNLSINFFFCFHTKYWVLVLFNLGLNSASFITTNSRFSFTDDGCGHYVLGQESGVLSSENYPGTYPNNSWCEWRIRVPIGHTIVLKFGDLNMEKKDCESDYLKVLKGSYGAEIGELFELFMCCTSCLYNMLFSQPLSIYSLVVTISSIGVKQYMKTKCSHWHLLSVYQGFLVWLMNKMWWNKFFLS